MGDLLSVYQLRSNPRTLVGNDTGNPPMQVDGLVAGDIVVPINVDAQVISGQIALILTVDTAAGQRWDAIPILGAVHPVFLGQS